jgi:hypothetical protein
MKYKKNNFNDDIFNDDIYNDDIYNDDIFNETEGYAIYYCLLCITNQIIKIF